MMAQAYEMRGDPSRALHYYKQVLELQRELEGTAVRDALVRFETRVRVERLEREALRYRMKVAEMEREMGDVAKNHAATELQLLKHNENITGLRKNIGRLASSSTADAAALARSLLDELDRRGLDADGSPASWRGERLLDYVRTRDLATRYTTLTPTELKICVLLRMGLSSKEIADILSASTMTVNTHRRNIRARLF
jgi:DNA-binding CsgD family transcriptional regulator